MRCTVDVGALAIVLAFDTEPAEVVDAAVEGMLASHGARRAPDA